MWQAAGDYLYKFLQLLHNLPGVNWGLAIVLMTVIVRLILHPLNAKQMRSMQQMQRIQPRLKVLQEKYGDDREALSRETMALYKEYNINPASGCLPLLIQLPILILLFNVLRRTSFGGESFLMIPLEGSLLSAIGQAAGASVEPGQLFGFTDMFRAVSANPSGLIHIGAYLPILILLLFIVFLTWYQQKISSNNNPQMASMNIIMPIFMGFICLSMPGGLLLYWMLSSLFAVLQQMYSIKKVSKEEKPVLFKDKPREGETAQRAVYASKQEKKPSANKPASKPAPRKKSYDIPVSSHKADDVYDDFDSFIPRKHRDK